MPATDCQGCGTTFRYRLTEGDEDPPSHCVVCGEEAAEYGRQMTESSCIGCKQEQK